MAVLRWEDRRGEGSSKHLACWVLSEIGAVGRPIRSCYGVPGVLVKIYSQCPHQCYCISNSRLAVGFDGEEWTPFPRSLREARQTNAKGMALFLNRMLYDFSSK